jgi:hypothetical protein
MLDVMSGLSDLSGLVGLAGLARMDCTTRLALKSCREYKRGGVSLYR